MTESLFRVSAVTARQHSIADGVTLNIAEATQQLLKRTQDNSSSQILESQLERWQHLKGARILSFLKGHPREKFHCCRLHIMLWPPCLEHWKPYLEQLDGSILEPDEKQAGSSLALVSGQEEQKMAHKHLDEYDLAIILCTRAWDNPATDPQTLREVRQRIRSLTGYLARPDSIELSMSMLKHGPLPGSEEEARQEIHQLRLYLSRCLTSTGKIKHVNPEIEKVYQAMRQAINRFLAACADPRINQYVTQHLISGIYFGWS